MRYVNILCVLLCVLLRFRSQNAEKDQDLKTDSQGEDWDFIPRKKNVNAEAHKNFIHRLTTHNAMPPV